MCFSADDHYDFGGNCIDPASPVFSVYGDRDRCGDVLFRDVYFLFPFYIKACLAGALDSGGICAEVPFAVVVGIGLLGTPVCLIPAVCGAFTYYMVHFVKMSSSTFKDGSANSMVEGLMSFTKQTLANKEMWVMIAAVIFCVLVVYSVRTRALDHAWKIASVAGTAAAVVVCVAGNVVLNTHISYVVLLVGGTAAIAVGLILEVLFLAVDYSRTEHLEFEDDEYHYYVKAVPKVAVSVPEKSVKHINERQDTGKIDVAQVKSRVQYRTARMESRKTGAGSKECR